MIFKSTGKKILIHVLFFPLSTMAKGILKFKILVSKYLAMKHQRGLIFFGLNGFNASPYTTNNK